MDCARGIKGELDLKPRAQACTRPQAPNLLPGGRRSPRSLFPVSGLMFVGLRLLARDAVSMCYIGVLDLERKNILSMGFVRFEFVFVRLT